MTDRPPPAARRPATSAPAASPDETELAAERAGVAYWRGVAHRRRIDAARIQRRPIVRAAVALDRRTAALQDEVARHGRRASARARRAATIARGWAARPTLDRRRTHLQRELEAVRATAPSPRSSGAPSTLLVHLGARPPVDDRSVELAAAADTHEVDALVARSSATLVCVIGPGTEPVDDTWLARLIDFVAVDADTRAACPLVIHPQRPWSEASPDDVLVRWTGLDVDLGEDGAPRPVGRDHGTAPDLGADPVAVAAATGSAVLMGRDAFEAAGGLGPYTDIDAAVVDLCVRHQARGGTVHAVASSVVTDDRPVTDPAQLRSPLEASGAAWTSLVDAHGPHLRRAAHPTDTGLSVALTTATPSAKMADRSGDWHYAGLVASALERAGHQVLRQTIDQADSAAGRSCDVHLVLRGLEPVRRTAGQRHVLWVISHPEALEIDECDQADLVLVASARFADHLRERTSTPVEVLLQATDPQRFRPVPPDAAHRHRVTVVANSRGVPRASVSDAVAAGLHPAVYGTGWDGLVDPDVVAAPYAPFEQLATVYSSATVVLNDHWETMRHWGFVSNRIFDVAACATPVLSDDVPEVGQLFGDLVGTWSDPSQLRSLVEAIEADPDGAERRAAALRDLVMAEHTFDHRVEELLGHLERHVPGAVGPTP